MFQEHMLICYTVTVCADYSVTEPLLKKPLHYQVTSQSV